MWAIWVAVAGIALASFYALLPESHLSSVPPDMSSELAGDMSEYRNELENYVIANHSASGAVPENLFAIPGANGNWNFTSQRWQNYVISGVVVVYPSTANIAPLPAGFVGAMLEQSGYSVEAGTTQNGYIYNATNTGGYVPLPAGMPSLPDGTPVWLAQVF